MRLVVPIAALTSLILLSGQTVAADSKGEVEVVQRDDGDTTVGAGTSPSGSGSGSTPAAASGPSTPRPVCDYFQIEGVAAGAGTPVAPTEGTAYVLVCTYPDGRETNNVVIYDPAEPAPDVVTAQDLAREATDLLALRAPQVRLNPDADAIQLVGVPTWMWLDDGTVDTISASAEVPGLSVSATAQATRHVWDMGDGTAPIVCTGAGTPYDTTRPPAGQSTDCRHTYQDAGTYTVTATTTWAIDWSASTGEAGTLADADRASTTSVTVIESQAVVVDG